jgi:hypothetical protein
LWKISASPSNIYTFSDDRELRADVYSVGNCGQYGSYATGSQFAGNYTLLGHQAEYGNDECLITNDTLSSFQAMVVRANGFLMDARNVDLDDIDALTHASTA